MSEEISYLRSVIPRTLSESVYKFKAGQKISEREIEAFFQVSSTSVKEAIFMLTAEGWVAIKSY